ncbi:MAG TPA: alpha/beta hydrolase [Verrucomicrobiae bacterium]|nr:alpha/beta hydrolase [Verrucomicrobiae bacterium]
MRSLVTLSLSLLALAGPANARTLGSISFTPCELSGTGSALVKAECARFDVPENPDAGGRSITLQLALIPARAPRPEHDIVVMLAGGPGQAATEAFPDVAPAFETLRKNRHILLIDQRGTGKSNPLKCALPDWSDPATTAPAALRAQAQRCLDAARKHSDPRWYTTTDAVRDLETVRQSMGGPRLNLLGVSYGTRVALEYLRRHPHAVRSAVLDAVVPPELALPGDHAANLDDALARIFAACRAAPDCAQRFGDPARTLDKLRAQLALRPVAATLQDPRTHVPLRQPLTLELLAGVVRLYAYQPETAALLPLLLDEAAQGRAGPLVGQAELIYKRLGDSLAHGMELSVICTEDAPFLRPNPNEQGRLLGAQLGELTREQCAVWPRGTLPADFKLPVSADAPVLLLSGELDPVTPPRYAEQVARTLPRSRALVLKGQGHSAIIRGCVPRLVRQFIDAADAAALDPSCLDPLAAMPAFTSFQGPPP